MSVTEYESSPGYLFYNGSRFVCPCGNKDFKVEIGSDPLSFWCACGVMYTEELANALGQEREEIAKSGE